MTDSQSEWTTLSVPDGTEMHAYIARSRQAGTAHKSRGIIIFQEAFGVNHYIRDITERFANEGYLAIAPELFHRTGNRVELSYTDDSEKRAVHMTALTDEGLAADIKAAHTWLLGEGMRDIAAIGFCMGGRTAYLATMTVPLSGAISFYGGGIAQTLVERTSEVNAPLLLIWGGNDAHIRKEHRDSVTTALTANKKSFENVVFSDADHGFFCNERASFNAKASSEAWPFVLKFLDTHAKQII